MIQIILSEWGKHSPPFKDIKAAIKHCKKNNLLDGKEGILWIKGTSRSEMDLWRIENEDVINHEYMRLMYQHTIRGKKWEWCNIFLKWDAYPELQTSTT